MSRGLTVALSNALSASTFTPILFAELEFNTTTLNISDQDRDIIWDSKTWLGNGLLRPVTGLNESANLQGTGARITLSGADSTLLSLVLSESNQVQKATLWLGSLDSAGAVIADPYIVFKGKLDVPEISDSGKEAIIAINYESDLMILERSSELRYTQETQRRFFSDDKAFEYVPQIASSRIYWGKAGKPPKTVKPKVKKGNN